MALENNVDVGYSLAQCYLYQKLHVYDDLNKLYYLLLWYVDTFCMRQPVSSRTQPQVYVTEGAKGHESQLKTTTTTQLLTNQTENSRRSQ